MISEARKKLGKTRVTTFSRPVSIFPEGSDIIVISPVVLTKEKVAEGRRSSREPSPELRSPTKVFNSGKENLVRVEGENVILKNFPESVKNHQIC